MAAIWGMSRRGRQRRRERRCGGNGHRTEPVDDAASVCGGSRGTAHQREQANGEQYTDQCTDAHLTGTADGHDGLAATAAAALGRIGRGDPDLVLPPSIGSVRNGGAWHSGA
jgi:hypothetical protein